MADSSSASGFGGIVRGPLVNKDGSASPAALQLFRDWNTRLTKGLNQIGQLIGEISAGTVITGRTEGIGTTVQHINDTGVITPPGMVSATGANQGAVVLPSGATSNALGSAALSNTTDFDAAGSAATAQANAETFATGAANTAQSNAEDFASNASNLTTGIIPFGRFPGISGTVTLAALTGGGTQGSLTFTSGLITGVVAPT